MNPQHLKALAIFADQAEPVDCSAPELRELSDALFAKGWLNICPPGWRYKINDAGLEALAKAKCKATGHDYETRCANERVYCHRCGEPEPVRREAAA